LPFLLPILLFLLCFFEILFHHPLRPAWPPPQAGITLPPPPDVFFLVLFVQIFSLYALLDVTSLLTINHPPPLPWTTQLQEHSPPPCGLPPKPPSRPPRPHFNKRVAFFVGANSEFFGRKPFPPKKRPCLPLSPKSPFPSHPSRSGCNPLFLEHHI